jgi:hypothetical protein
MNDNPMRSFLFAPLAGAYFRPPAKQVLAALPAGAKLRLEPEPDNPYDPGAVKVLVGMEEVPAEQDSELDVALAGVGTDVGTLRAAEQEIFLGYVAKTGGKPLAKAQLVALAAGSDAPLVGNQDIAEAAVVAGVLVSELTASLVFGPDGTPLVRVVVAG